MNGRNTRRIKSRKPVFTLLHSEFVDAPVINEYPLTLKCKVIEMQEVLDEMHVVDEVINVQADDSILGTQGKIDFGRN